MNNQTDRQKKGAGVSRRFFCCHNTAPLFCWEPSIHCAFCQSHLLFQFSDIKKIRAVFLGISEQVEPAPQAIQSKPAPEEPAISTACNQAMAEPMDKQVTEQPAEEQIAKPASEQKPAAKEKKPSVLARLLALKRGGTAITVKPESEETSAVYMYDGDYSDYAILVDDNDERVISAIERHGKIVKEYVAVSNNNDRKPIDSQSVKDRISEAQGRWRWPK